MDQQRLEAAAELFAGFTEREQKLIKEAAVMGFVQGRRCASDPESKTDGWILQTVHMHCQSNADLYPTITGYTPTEEDPE